MSKKLIMKIISGAIAILLLLGILGQAIRADGILDKPVYAYGESLTEKQIQETARLLSVEDDALKMQVNIQEMNGLLHDNYPYYQVYSSVYLKPLEDGSGIKVNIATPETITSITANQYANAAITAGAVDMDITVASVKAVDGSGALAGVYKAFQGTSGALPEENIKLAQEELNVTSRISEENKEKKGYSDDVLNAAVAEIKAEVDQTKEENDGSITNVQIGEIVNNIINNYNLDGVLTEENKAALSQLMEKFSKLELTEEQKEALKNFGNRLIEEGGKLMDSIKSAWDQLSPEAKTEGMGFFRSIFQSIYDAIYNLFNSLFN